MSRISFPRQSVDAVLARSRPSTAEWLGLRLQAFRANRQDRALLRLLASMDDHLLDDIGITRGQIQVRQHAHRHISGRATLRRMLYADDHTRPAPDGLIFAAVVGAGLIALLSVF